MDVGSRGARTGMLVSVRTAEGIGKCSCTLMSLLLLIAFLSSSCIIVDEDTSL
jgi:hypothetical protein